jgi:putative peptidoglycan lipid II flippase
LKISIRSIGVVSILTLLTNLLGFVREMFIARSFGASVYADAFAAAWSIVAACFLIFSSVTIQAAFMPIYQNAQCRSEAAARGLFWRCVAWVAGCAFALTMLLAVFAPEWTSIVLPGFTDEKRELTITLIRILALTVIFVVSGALLQSVCHAHQRFAAPALIPVANNVLIIALLTVVPKMGIEGLAWAFVAGAALWSGLGLTLRGELSGPLEVPSNDELRGVFTLGLPVMFVLLADQVSGLIQKALVSGLSTGSIASLAYAAKLVGVPVGIFAVAVATVFFPALTAALQSRDHKIFQRHFRTGLAGVVLLSAPASVVMAWAAEPITRLAFQRGAFDAQATQMTAHALMYYAWGLVPQGMIVYFNRVFYSAKDTRTPMYIGLISVVFHVVACVLAVRWMGYVGIAAGTTLYGIIYAVMLGGRVRKVVPVERGAILSTLGRFAAATGIMFAALGMVRDDRLVITIAACAIASILYLVVLLALREPLVLAFVRGLRRSGLD